MKSRWAESVLDQPTRVARTAMAGDTPGEGRIRLGLTRREATLPVLLTLVVVPRNPLVAEA